MKPNSFHVVDATGLSDEQLLCVARETNYSETTFFHSVSERDGGYRVRIFTPVQEIPFTGHPILGAAWAYAITSRWARPMGFD
jgi:trans-2,3-dihydro-3-hydroxyanthranilate isomerase